MAALQMAPKKDKLFLNRLFESLFFKELRLTLDRLLERPLWWVSEKKRASDLIKPLPKTQRPRDIQDYLSLSDYKKTISEAIGQAEQAMSLVVFSHSLNNTYGIAIPLVKEDKIFGFFGICELKTKPSQVVLDIIAGYVKVLSEEVSKELELARVYELVRPRAIALSTVHTINRLISSTLDIKEVFPRIARLSLQVLRAERARISMIDKQTKKLTCVASVNYTKTKDVFKITSYSLLEKKVAQTGVSIRRNNLVCAPLVEEEICGVISVRDKMGGDSFTIFDQEILTTLAEQAVIAIKNAQSYKEQEDITLGTVKSLALLLDAKFPGTYTHTEFFVELMLELGKEAGLSKEELKLLHYSAILPDLGKLVVPEEILKKTKALSSRERRIIKTHTIRGIEILKYIDVLRPVVPIILHHHERYDGKGYPGKLKGKKIPFASRVMAVGDTFEAMVCQRPYRNSLPFRMAVSEIRRQAGSQFDPDVVKVFIRLANDGTLERLMKKHQAQLKKPLG